MSPLITPARAARPLTAVLAVLLALLLASPAPAQQNTTTHYGYDPQGNLTTVTDPRSLVTDHSYDALNRLTRTLQPPAAAGGARPAIRSSYDGQDRPTTITDPKNLATSSTLDGLGNLTAQNSPDSGSTTQTHDAAGNVLTRSDARNKISTYRYDALNRVTEIAFNDATPPLVFGYDSGANARGRLSWIGDGSTVTVWAYDSQGRVGAKQQMHATRQYSLLYPHDTYGRPQGIVYPSGIGVVRQYDAAGRVNALIALGTGEPQVVHYVVQFQPFGPPAGAIYGNGQPRIDVFDLDGRRYAYSRDGAYRVIGYDAASRIPYIYPDTVPAQGDQYSYDDLDRLTQWISPTTTQGYAYDLSGDRTQRSIGANPYNYTYPAGSHRLASTSGPSPAQTNQYDAAGNLIDDGTRHFTYDARGRLIQASQGTIVASYVVNAFGQRVQKAVSGGATPTQTHFVYDEAGHLLGEYDALSGLPIQEYVWYDDTLVGILRGSPASFAVYSVETDHLGTPRQVRDVNRQLRWQWDSDPFGSILPNANPAGLGNFTLNLRFPGQYYDEESGLHYNVFRDYDPGVGRYVQSDPIGLAGGINTYGYVGGNPVSRVDPLGLRGVIRQPGSWIPGAGSSGRSGDASRTGNPDLNAGLPRSDSDSSVLGRLLNLFRAPPKDDPFGGSCRLLVGINHGEVCGGYDLTCAYECDGGGMFTINLSPWKHPNCPDFWLP
jgi:RHS repeat-associated protein